MSKGAKRLLRVLAIVAGVILIIMTALQIVLNSRKVRQIVDDAAAEAIDGSLAYSRLHFDVFRSFPRLRVTLDSLSLTYPHDRFAAYDGLGPESPLLAAGRGADADTLAAFSRFTAAVNVWRIIRWQLRLSDAYGDNARTRLARLGGQVVGVVRTTGGKLDCQSAAKAAKFVRFCDAFSIPVITFVDCAGFESLKSAAKLSAAYAEATTVKLSVVVGEAIGSAYVALAGTGANADVVYALPEAVISPVNIEAAAFILAPDAMKVPASEQQAAAAAFAQENLSAFNAAQNGYVDGIVPFEELRGTLLSALDMLSGKRVPTVAKKHCTI